MATWLEAANGWSSFWASAMTRACWQGGLALALVWAWCRLVPRTPGRVRCWLWRLAYIKLLAALVWASPIPLPLLRPVVRPPVAAALATLSAARAMPVPAAADENSPPAAALVSISSARVRPSAPPPSPLLWLAALWAAGVSVCAARLGLAWRATVRLRRRCELVDDSALRHARADLAGRYGLRRCPPLLSADGIASPLLVGVLRPAVVLPRSLHAACPAGELRLVLAHELAHLKRRDLAWNALAAVAEGLFYFHPLVWLARREWRLAQEVACDEAALAVTQARPAEYAGVLLRAVENWTPAHRVVAAGMFRSGRTLERRLVAMKHFNNRPRRLWLAGVMVLCVGGVGIPTWKVVAQETPTTQPAKRSEQTAANGGESARRDPAPQPAKTATGPGFLGVGIVKARQADIKPPALGVVREVRFKEGEKVKAGDVLFQMDDRMAKVRIAAAEADLKGRQAAAKTQRNRFDVGLINTVEEVVTAEAAAEAAKVTLELRRLELEQTRLTAPFDGVIASSNAYPGQVTANETLATVAEVGDLKIEFTVPLEARPKLREGMKAQFTARINYGTDPAARREPPSTGQIYFISLVRTGGLIQVKATLDNPHLDMAPNTPVDVFVPVEN